jgi:hypothetical protein
MLIHSSPLAPRHRRVPQHPPVADGRPRILVVSPTIWDRAAWASPALRAAYEPVFCCEDFFDGMGMRRALRFDVFRYLRRVLEAHGSTSWAGVLGTGDYPGCLFSAYLAEQLGLPSPRLQDIVVLSHKLYSREIQRRLVPEATPDFEAIDPLALREPKQFGYPFFLKPVRGAMSILARMVHAPEDLQRAMHFTLGQRLRGHILLQAYAQLLDSCVDSQVFGRHVPAHAFIAETPLTGQQVTIDGFVQNREVMVLGVVDSVMHEGTTSFRRFEYPSRLKSSVQARMADVVRRLIVGSGLDHSFFNVEMFYDADHDTIRLIEINPRMSYQFNDFYEHVDGTSLVAAQLALATGQSVDWRRGQGPEKVAASFILRHFTDAKVRSVPSRRHLDEVRDRFPTAHVQILCRPGERLSDREQDTSSFRCGIVNLAARSRDELYASYGEIERLLPFELD